MIENGIRFIVKKGNWLNCIPDITTTREIVKNDTPKKRIPKSLPRANSSPKMLFGIEIQDIEGLGNFHKSSRQPFWKTMLSALKKGQGFEVERKDFNAAEKATSKYSIESKKIWGQSRRFILEKNVTISGQKVVGKGRVGRIK